MTEEKILFVVTGLLAFSELLALLSRIKSNSVFTFIYNTLKKIQESL